MGVGARTLEVVDLTETTPEEETEAAPTGKILRNMGVLVLGQAATVPLVFATSVLLVRHLGSEGFGEYAFVYAFVGLFTWLATFGMENIVVREASKEPEEAGEIWGSAFVTAALASIAAAALAFGIALASGYSSGKLLFLAGIEIIALATPRLVLVAFQVHLQQWKGVTTNLGRQAAWLVAVVILVRGGATVGQLIFWRVVIAAVETAINVYLARNLLGRPFSLSRPRFKYLLGEGWPLALTYLSIGVYHRIDRVLLESFVGPAELGYYAAADNILTFLSLVPLAFMMSVYPILCRRLDQPMAFDRIAKSAYRLTLFWVAGACGTLFGLSYPVVTALYGNDFAFTAKLINILLLSQFAMVYGIVISQVMIARSQQRLITITTVAGAAINVIANLYALPRWGAVGAGWVTVGSYWVAGILLFHVFPSARHDSAIGLSVLARVAVVGGIAFLLPQLLFDGHIVPVASGVALFVAGSLVSRVIGRGDIDLLKRAIKRETPPDDPDALAEEETLLEVSRSETT